MGSIDKAREYAACMLATKTKPDSAYEIADGPSMIGGGVPMLRVVSREVWLSLKSLDIPTGAGFRVAPTDDDDVVKVGRLRFHLSWIRAIEAEHGRLIWALSAGRLTSDSGHRGRFLGGYKRGKRVAMVAQLGPSER